MSVLHQTVPGGRVNAPNGARLSFLHEGDVVFLRVLFGKRTGGRVKGEIGKLVQPAPGGRLRLSAKEKAAETAAVREGAQAQLRHSVRDAQLPQFGAVGEKVVSDGAAELLRKTQRLQIGTERGAFNIVCVDIDTNSLCQLCNGGFTTAGFVL